MRKILVLLIFGLGLVSWLRAAPGPQTIEALPVTVNASVSPQISDFPIALTSTTASETVLGTETKINYTVSYSSLVYYATNPTLEVVWSKGESESQPVTTADVLLYVSGSATTASPNGSPVVDLENRKISWSINALPARSATNTVNFSLITNSINSGSGKMKFTVSARLIARSVVVPDVTLTHYYSNTSSPSATPTPSPSPSPTPTTPNGNPTSLNIGVSILNITQDKAKIKISVSPRANIKFDYGLSISELTESINSAQEAISHEISLDNLIPNTSYFFKIKAVTSDLSKISDIYTFKTAEISTKPQVSKDTIVVTSQETIIVSTENDPYAVIPTDSNYKFSFAIGKSEGIKSVSAVLRGKHVQGINSLNELLPQEQSVDLISSRPGVYVGELRTPDTLGEFELIAIVSDYFGNKNEQHLLDIRSVTPLMIFKKDTTIPVESARVLLSIWDSGSGEFKPIPPRSIIKLNPIYSEPSGIVPLSLPNGKYQVNVIAIGFEDKTVEFTLGKNENLAFPKIYLTAKPFSIANYLKYHAEASGDVAKSSAFIFKQFSQSSRFFDLVSSLTILLVILVTLFSFSLHTRIPLYLIPEYIFFKLLKITKLGKHKLIISGIIRESDTHNSISNAKIYIIDPKNNRITHHLTSNRFGEFVFERKLEIETLKILVIKKGYEPMPPMTFDKNALEFGSLNLYLNKYPQDHKGLIYSLELITDHLLEILFESSMVISLILELLFAYSLGIMRAAPFLVLSCITLVFWIISDVVIITKYEQSFINSNSDTSNTN